MSEGTGLAGSFQHAGVATAYAYRPPYPAAVLDVLDALIVAGPRHVLDLGAGDGALARPLAARVDRVDAVEISAAMVEAGRRRPGGQRDNLVWHLQAAEELSLPGPYALAVAGASLHWMNWEITLERVRRALAPGAVLAIVNQNYHDLAWRDDLREVIVRYSRNPGYDQSFSLPDELQRRGLFEIDGRRDTPPTEFRQSVEHYIEQFHSTASLARELMAPDEAARFDDDVRAVVRDHQAHDRKIGQHQSDGGELLMEITGHVVWGRILR